MAALTPGTQLKRGTFVITAEIGRGGFGEVFLAQQPRMGRDVAIKVLLPHVAENAEAVARFEREARAAASLVHPNVLPVFDFDFDEEAGVWFLAMQYIHEGHTLTERMGTPMPVAEVARIVAAIGEALDAAHELGIVHRDVKPANVLMDGERPLLTDFGIAHLGAMASMTATGIAMGTPAYMSPEQALGHPIGPKADQYALAIMTYEMLAGRLPFEGDPLSLIHQQVSTPPPPLVQFNPAINAAVRAAVVLALSKDPEDRFDTCAEFAADLLVASTLPPGGATHQPSVAIPVAAQIRPVILPAPVSPQPAGPPPRPPGGQPADRADITPAVPVGFVRAAPAAPSSPPPSPPRPTVAAARPSPQPAPRPAPPPVPAAPSSASAPGRTNNRFRVIFIVAGVVIALLLVIVGIIVGESPRPSPTLPSVSTPVSILPTGEPASMPAARPVAAT